jgi:hypothetical protein
VRPATEDNFARFMRRALAGKENSWWLALLYPVRGAGRRPDLRRWMRRLFGHGAPGGPR